MNALYNFWFISKKAPCFGFMVLFISLLVATASQIAGHFRGDENLEMAGFLFQCISLVICSFITIPLTWWKSIQEEKAKHGE